MEQPAKQVAVVTPDDRVLPSGQRDRPLVFLPGAVPREKARPVAAVALQNVQPCLTTRCTDLANTSRMAASPTSMSRGQAVLQ